ncbi:MAG: hypothetical protein NTX17_06035 [Candidatus Eisenbacteria bacterium]|nr:hypothetical protein [Candidatus Eisenbacteria bacterium]
MAKKTSKEAKKEREKVRGRQRRADKRAEVGPREFPFSKRPVLFVSIILVVLLALLFNQLVFARKIFVSADVVAPLGFATVAEESMKKGGPYPLWNPYVFLGMPSFSSLTYNPSVYFPDVILKGVEVVLPFLPPMTWLLIYYFLAGLFTFLLLRGGGLSLEAGFFAAVVFMLTPNLVAIGAFGHGSKLITSAFIPIVMMAAWRLLSRGGALWFGFLALVAGLQLLRAHVQIVYYTWMALGLYCVLFLLMKSPNGLRFPKRLARVGFVVGALVVALALAAVLYLPVHDYSAYSSRGGAEGGGLEFGRATDWSFSPVEMMTFLVPSWLGFGGSTYWGSMPFTDYPNYMGILPLFLALVGLLGVRKRETLFFGLVALLSLLISFGKHFEFLYRLLYEGLPYFNKFRVPVMILVLLQFSVAALAAYGIEKLRREREDPKRGPLERVSLAIALAFAAVWLLWLLFGGSLGAWYENLVTGSPRGLSVQAAEQCLEMVKRDILIVGFIGFAGFMSIHLFLKRKLTAVLLVAILACLTIVDIWRVDNHIFGPMLGERSSVSTESFRDDTIEFLQRDSSLYRILPTGQSFTDNSYAGFGIASVGGYHAAKPALYEQFYDGIFPSSDKPGRLTPAVLAMLNVKYLVTPDYIPQGPLVTLVHDGSKKVYQFNAALPRAYLVDSVVVLADTNAVLDAIASNWFDPSKTALLLEPTPSQAVTKEGSSVRIVSYGLNRIDIEANVAKPCFMVLSELFYPDWKAKVDGVQAKIYRTDFLLRGLPLSPGNHAITFIYDSRSLKRGMLVSAGASIVIVVSFVPAVVGLVRRGKRSEIARHSPDIQ